jgi:hypothetical protein
VVDVRDDREVADAALVHKQRGCRSTLRQAVILPQEWRGPPGGGALPCAASPRFREGRPSPQSRSRRRLRNSPSVRNGLGQSSPSPSVRGPGSARHQGALGAAAGRPAFAFGAYRPAAQPPMDRCLGIARSTCGSLNLPVDPSTIRADTSNHRLDRRKHSEHATHRAWRH